MNYIILAQNIKNARKEKHYTQEKLAELVNCSTVFISQIETGVRVPSLETLYNIADVLGVTIDSLFSDSNNIANTDFYTKEIINLIKDCTDSEIKLVFDIVNVLCNNFNTKK
jgi:transcriptional regulator with XRE-family HTH domain